MKFHVFSTMCQVFFHSRVTVLFCSFGILCVLISAHFVLSNLSIAPTLALASEIVFRVKSTLCLLLSPISRLNAEIVVHLVDIYRVLLIPGQFDRHFVRSREKWKHKFLMKCVWCVPVNFKS